jgi:uncharacterized membrane protein
MEAQVLSSVTGLTAIDLGSVLGTLGDPDLLTALGPSSSNPSTPPDANILASTTLSADAQTLILNAVANGDNVITPTQMVTVNGTSTVGWWETDQYGHTVSHFADGGHQAIAEYGNALEFATKFNAPTAQFIGQIGGIGITGIVFAGSVLQGVAQQSSFTGILQATKDNIKGVKSGAPSDLTDFLNNFNKVVKKLDGAVPSVNEGQIGLLSSFAKGLKQGIKFITDFLKAQLLSDPDVFPFLGTPYGITLAGVNPGNAPIVAAQITTDPIFTMPFNGNELPVYDLTVTNFGPVTDTFNLTASDPAGQFNIYPGSPSLTLQPGQAGQVNLCASPITNNYVTMAPVGTTLTFNVGVASPTSTANAGSSVNYVMPAIPSISVGVDPPTLSVTPGQMVSANLNISAVGNASPGSVTLTAAPDTGITVTALTSPVTVPLNGVVTLPLIVTAGANTASNTYYVTITASYTTAAGAQTATFSLPVAVGPLGKCSLSAALSANQTGKNSMAAILSSLAADMNAAAAAPSNAALVSRIGGDLTVLQQNLNVPYLQSFSASLTAAGTGVAQATPATLVSALGNLDAAICPIGTAVSQASSYNSTLYLYPPGNTATTGPNLPVTFGLDIQNNTNLVQVYDLSVTGVPSGVSTQFSASKIALGTASTNLPNAGSVTLTITPGASFTAPFTFTVVATPEGAPEFAISASGSLLVRPQAVSLDNLAASPTYGPPGTQFKVTARVFAEVNENTPAVLNMEVYNAAGTGVYGVLITPEFILTTTAGLQTISVGTIDSTSLPNGPYTFNVYATTYPGEVLIPGATGTGSFLVGAPLSGALTANAASTPPGSIPTGNSTVQVALNITRDSVLNPLSTLVGSVQLSGVPRTMVLYQNGAQQLAYVCSDSYVNIVDVTTSSSPQVLSTLAHDILTTENGATVAGFQGVSCAIYNNNLILAYSRYDGNTTGNPIPTHFATYSLANPLSPVEVGSVVDIPRSDSAGLYVAGNTALLYQSDVFYNQFSNFIYQQNGDIWSADLTNAGATGAVTFLNDVFSCGGLNSNNQCNNTVNVTVAAPNSCAAGGTTPVPNDPTKGGPYRLFAGIAVNGTTSYFGSSSSSGGNLELPGCPPFDGQLLVVDTTAPAAPTITSRVDDPAMAFMNQVAIQGNTAISVGDSVGIYDASSGFTGTLVISSFDISNPTNPVLLNSVVTQLSDQPGASVVSLGQNFFAVGNTSNSGKPELVLVDASNPNALRYIPYDAVIVAGPTIAQNGSFFALSSTPSSTTNALSIFQLSQITGPQLTVKLQLPTTNCQNTSFNPAPTSCTAGSTSDTYQWVQPTATTITFSENVTGVNPGDVPVVVNGGELDFTLPSLGSGKFLLAPLTVLCQQILSINPESTYVNNAGSSASFAVTVSNPTSSTQTYVPSTLGIPSTWGVQLPASVTVAAGATQNFNLVLTTALNTPWVQSPPYQFFVVVNTAGGITASVGAALRVFGGPPQGSGTSTQFSALAASLNPSQLTLGMGGTGAFTISLTNTGNTAAYMEVIYPSNVPNNWSLNFSPGQFPSVSPGLSNTLTVTGTISLPSNAAPGPYVFVVPVQSQSNTVNLSLTVNVVGNGVSGTINPNSGPSSGTFALALQNIGSSQDSFNLSVIGPLSQAATIASSSGNIAPQGTAQIPINLNPVNYLLPGSYPLQIKAVSQSNPAVLAVISGTVQITGSKGVSASMKPSSASVSTTPGSLSLLFNATNTGNVNDTYTAAITGTTGPVTATLGGSSQTFALPALGAADFPLNATVNGTAPASITVTVTSLSDGAIHNQASIVIDNSTAGPPTAVAAAGGYTPVHRLTVLNASASSDPNGLPLTFLWTLTSAPPGSALNSGSISLANNALAAFRPDVLGTYSFNVNVFNGAASANATATYTAIDAPPVAVTGNNYNTAVGGFAFLNGKNSYDPDSQPIGFAWTLVSAPNSSTVTSASIYNSQTTHAFFTPDVAGAYQFQLIVTDATASSLPALITVTAYSGVIPPNADAGPSQNSGLYGYVTVNGGNSVDPNTSPLPLNYQWTLTSIPSGSGSVLGNATSAQAFFVTDLPGQYTASLVVSNANGTSPAATTTVYTFAGDVPPNANAGANQFVTPTNTANLNSQASADPDGGPIRLGFLWWLDSLPSGSAAVLQQAATATPTFVADKSGYYIGRVEANDGLLAGFANTVVTSAATCDADANGVINQTDIQLIQAAIGQTALPNDPRDFDKSGTITAADVTACSNLVSVTPPTLQVLPAQFTETLAQGGPAVMQTLQISSSGNPINFTVTSNQPWLTASVTSDSTSAISSLEAIVTPGSLAPNTYNGMLTFTPTTGSAQTVSVTLTIVSSSPIGASPSNLTFNASYGGAAPPSQPVSVTSNSGAANFTVASDSPWLQGGVSSGATPQTLNVTATPGNLTPGAYSGNLTIASGANTAKVSVTFNITEAGSLCDVNQDGLINVLDFQKLINEAMGMLAPANDLNHDGVVNVVDLQIDSNAVLGLGCAAH